MSQTEQTRGKNKHIFMVNRSAELLEVVRGLLQDEEYNVTTTNFVPETFDQVAALDPDLLIIDLVIGQRSSWALLERLTADATMHRIPIIVLSTNADLLEEAQADPARYGAQRFIRKPFDLEDLLSAVEELIGRA
ncbi:MAG TPA: response regulator [Thermomicrobiales bacterium]|nr:response regulator [Thermomicrobiales bacterium]